MSVYQSYGKALQEAAFESKMDANAQAQIESQLDAVLKLLKDSKELRTALSGPVCSAAEKNSISEQIAAKIGLSPLVTRFLKLVIARRRLDRLEEIIQAFREVRIQAEGGVAGTLVAADPLGEEDVKSLAQSFGQKLGKRVAFRVLVDPSLLAGVKATVNGVTYDGTLRAQLARLRNQVLSLGNG